MLRSSLIALSLAAAAPAAAQDLSTALEIWTVTHAGQDGNDQHDEAQGIAIDSAGDYVIVGHQDGMLLHGTDAFVRKLDNTGADVWEVIDDRGLSDVLTKPSSDDAYWDVEVDSTNQVCLVGGVSGDTSTGWDSGYYVAKLTDYDGSVTWEDTWQDGGASTDQAGTGIDLDSTGDLHITGWSFRHPNQEGQWASFRYVTTTGYRDLGPLYYDLTNDPEAMDKAMDIAVDSQGNFIVVGAVGNAGATGPDDADFDWHVRKYDSGGLLLWEDTWAGVAGLADVATAVVVDSIDEIIVVGYTNKGTDNGAGADYDWLVVRYDEFGGAGYGNRIWETSWQDPTTPGAKEQLFDAHIAENNADIVVGGTWDDAGDAAWRVAVLSWVDGAETSAWAWPAATGGDSRVNAIDVLDGRVAAAGSVWNGTDLDSQVAVLDQDDDGDGLGDSVDGCPFDPLKIEPGDCGCGNPDVDTDYDTFLDCDDACPELPDKWLDEGICGCDETDLDGDGDGTPDCIDNCPTDPAKISLGICGCNLPDDDSDGDGVVGCDDACSNTPAGTPVDDFGCPVEDCGNGVDDNSNNLTDCDDPSCEAEPACADGGTGDGDGDKGCGCSSTPGSAGFLVLGLAALAVRRRR